MSEETLSALLDGECSDGELELVLRRLDREPGLRERFARMSRAQDLRQGRLARTLPADFSSRVMAALPPRPAAVRGLPPRFWRPLAGLAAAAAFGAAAVLVIRPDAPGQASPVLVRVPTATPVASASLEDREYARLDDASARQLRNYLMAYSQARAQQGVGGTLGYARYAAYTDDRAGTAEKPR